MPYDDFSIEKGEVYVNDYLKDIKYTFKDISYNTIVCEAFKHYLNYYLKEEQYPDMIWPMVFPYVEGTNFSVLEVLKEENYIKNHKENILKSFYFGFQGLESEKAFFDFFTEGAQNSETEKFSTHETNFYKEKLLNIFIYCEIPRSSSVILRDNFFLEKSYKNIILYYRKLIADIFKIDVKDVE